MFVSIFKSSLISSILLLVLGFLLIFESEMTIMTISYIVGGILVALGVMAFLRFIKKNNSNSLEELDIVYGMVTVILGILIITNPHAIASIIPLILGAGIIINSSMKLQYAFELKKCNSRMWISTLIIAIISALCGIVLLFNPFKGAVMITKIIGIFIVCYAVLDFIALYIVKRNINQIKNTVGKVENAIYDAEIVGTEEYKQNDKKNKKQK